MRKKGILACMLVVTMLLTGCALIEKDEAVDRAREVVRVSNPAGGEDIVYTKGQVLDEVDYQLTYMAAIYSAFGMAYDITDPGLVSQTKDDVMDMLVEDAVSTLKAQELGLDQFTEEELQEISDAVDADMASTRESIQAEEFADSQLEEAELSAALDARMAELNLTREVYEQSHQHAKMLEKLEDYVIADVAVTPEELQAAFDEEVAAQQASYDATPSSFVTAMNNGSTIYYAPAGVRLVQQILLQFLPEDQAVIDAVDSALADAQSRVTSLSSSLEAALGTDAGITAQELADQVQVTLETPAAGPSALATVSDLTANFAQEVSAEAQDLAQQLATAQAEVAFFEGQLADAQEAGWANLKETAESIHAQLSQGADFEAMIDAYNEDPGMDEGSTARENGGYAVCEGYTSFDEDFLNAAMALDQVGDISNLVRSQFGIHILRYAADVPQGPVALETVQEGLESSLLSEKQTQTYDDQIAAWIEEADVTTHREILDD